MTRRQYTVHQFQGPDTFVVKLATSMWEPIMTDRATVASNQNPEDVRFFGMTLAEANALSDHLEANYRTV